MQEQSSPVQVKDPYTGSILKHCLFLPFYPQACRLILHTHQSVQCTPPKKNKKLIERSIKHDNKKNNNRTLPEPLNSFLNISAIFVEYLVSDLVNRSTLSFFF